MLKERGSTALSKVRLTVVKGGNSGVAGGAQGDSHRKPLRACDIGINVFRQTIAVISVCCFGLSAVAQYERGSPLEAGLVRQPWEYRWSTRGDSVRKHLQAGHMRINWFRETMAIDSAEGPPSPGNRAATNWCRPPTTMS
jgi:hypothetical protein